MTTCGDPMETGGGIPPAAARPERGSVLVFVRRLHMYLGIALVPWFFMYAAGAFVLNHTPLVESWLKTDKPEWTKRFEKEYECPVPANADARAIGARVVEDFGLTGRSYDAWWGDGHHKQLIITSFKFLSTTRLTYSVKTGQIIAEDQSFRLDRFLVGMHERGGFLQAPWLTVAWGVLCDIVGLAVLTWAISGLYIWWKVHRRHVGGGLVLAAGVVCFVVLVALL